MLDQLAEMKRVWAVLGVLMMWCTLPAMAQVDSSWIYYTKTQAVPVYEFADSVVQSKMDSVIDICDLYGQDYVVFHIFHGIIYPEWHPYKDSLSLQIWTNIHDEYLSEGATGVIYYRGKLFGLYKRDNRAEWFRPTGQIDTLIVSHKEPMEEDPPEWTWVVDKGEFILWWEIRPYYNNRKKEN